jgi:hypothetical protein
MKSRLFQIVLGSLVLASGAAWAQSAVLSKHGFGTVRGRACVGPVAPTSSAGVQIIGSTTGAQRLTWQVYSVSSQTADALVFETTARSVNEVIAPEGNLLYHACVVKAAGAAQAYDLVLNTEEL